MSPKNITRTALTIGLISLIGGLAIVIWRPDWGIWAWWPAMGLVASVLLLVLAFLYGAYLTAQRRAEMVDMLNDCYSGNTQTTSS
jgi:hypothetical protein